MECHRDEACEHELFWDKTQSQMPRNKYGSMRASGRTSAATQPQLSRTSAAPQPHLSRNAKVTRSERARAEIRAVRRDSALRLKGFVQNNFWVAA